MIINNNDAGQLADRSVAPGVVHSTRRAGAYRTIGRLYCASP
jgi:hypothetical protein